jgi:hypothetical protein
VQDVEHSLASFPGRHDRPAYQVIASVQLAPTTARPDTTSRTRMVAGVSRLTLLASSKILEEMTALPPRNGAQ